MFTAFLSNHDFRHPGRGEAAIRDPALLSLDSCLRRNDGCSGVIADLAHQGVAISGIGIATVAALLRNDNHFIQGLEIKLTPTLDPCVRRRAYFISKAAVTSMDGMNAVVTASATVAPPSLWTLLHGRRSPHPWAILCRVGSAPTISVAGVGVTSTPMSFPLSTVVGAHTRGRFFAECMLQGAYCRSPFRATSPSHSRRKPVLTPIPFSCHREPSTARFSDLKIQIATVADAPYQ